MNRFEWFALIGKVLNAGSGILTVIKNIFGGGKE